MTKYLFFPIFILIIAGCDPYPGKVCKTLEQSGSNRGELEKVLTHYAQNPNDSLKLRAAEFLIANMPGHYSIAGEEMDRYVAQVDSMYPNLVYYLYPSVYLQPYDLNKLQQKPERKYDITTLTAEYLIKNIDFKFALRETVPWGNSIPFTLFCETILPYRIDVEPLKDIPQDSLNRYLNDLKTAVLAIKDVKLRTDVIIHSLSSLICSDKQSHISTLPYPVLNYVFDCAQIASKNKNINTLICIPSSIDFTPHWAMRNDRHNWCCVHDFGNSDYKIGEIQHEIAAKIYRKTFSGNEYTDGEFNTRFWKDVTAKYLNSQDAIVEIAKGIPEKNIYLCVFNEQSWQPIAWSKSTGRQVIFRDVAQNVLYLPVIYTNGQQQSVGHPFYVDMCGRICVIKHDSNTHQQLHLTRKSSIRDWNIHENRSLVGIVVEASQYADFRTYERIDSIADMPGKALYEKIVRSDKIFRYWRIRKNVPVILAELRFYDNNDAMIGGTSIYGKNSNSSVVGRLFDNDFLTSGYFYDWLGMDFGNPIPISKIEIAPQTDVNYIYMGNVYELFYHDGRDWVSLGMKEATDYCINFENAPVGALYWLHNLIEGREERPFIFEKGRMRFM